MFEKRIGKSKVVRRIACFSAAFLLGITNVGGTLDLHSIETAYADTVTEPKVVNLIAYYMGSSVLVGDDIEPEKLKVAAWYEDGTSSDVKGYTLATTRITQVGSNECIVIYKGKVAKFYITGKTLSSFRAYYSGSTVSVGNSVDPSKIIATAVYSDGSVENVEDFNIVNKVITSTGNNTITITYRGLTYNITAYGTSPKELLTLYATFTGESVMVGGSIDPRKLEVTAVYKDGSSEKINNYTLSPEIITKIGVQLVVASYHGLSAPFQVTGAQKDIVSLKATYKGDPVGVGYSVRKSDVEVIATYSDGTKQQITDFNLSSPTIAYEGYHIMIAEAGGASSEFIVQGVGVQNITFSNALGFNIVNGKYKGKVDVNLPKNVKASLFTGESLPASSVSRLLSRMVSKSEFIAFEIGIKDDDLADSVIDEFPLIMRVTIPDGFNVKDCELYFSPNRKTIIGKMSTDITGTKTLQCTIYSPGTYILSYKKK
jgi:hypothetical protein